MSKNESQPRRALGKGVGALLPTRPAPSSPPVELPHRVPSELPFTLHIDTIDPNPLQPRRIFDAEKLHELAQSIRENGIIQPLVVRRAGDRYQLIAGERRLRAAKLCNFREVPAVIRPVDDRELLQITLIENIQREDLNPIETALAFQRLASDLSLSVDEIASQTGKDRTTIVNFVRLLQLPEDLQQLVSDHKLSAGHARCLLSLNNVDLARETAQKSMAQGWSVRQMELATQKLRNPEIHKLLSPEPADPNVRAAIGEMERVLGTKVRVVPRGRKGGRIEIEYYTPEDLDRIYAAIVGES